MDAAELRAMQAPIKERYKTDPSAAFITLKAKGSIDNDGIACKVETGKAMAIAGLHPASGGSGAVTVPNSGMVTCHVESTSSRKASNSSSARSTSSTRSTAGA